MSRSNPVLLRMPTPPPPGRQAAATGFFSEPETFEALRRRFRGAIGRDRDPGDRVRIWVPGCSTGEEAYSVAITVIEIMEASGAGSRIQIFATDVDDSALQLARAAVYPDSIASLLSPEQLDRFFCRDRGRLRVRPAIRDLCVFARHDMVHDAPLARMDLVVYRNELARLEPAAQTRVLSLLHYSVRCGGMLALGPSETVDAPSRFFTAVPGSPGIYFRNDTAARFSASAAAADDSVPAAQLLQEPEEPVLTLRRPTIQSRTGRDQHVRALLDEQALTIEALRIANEGICASNEELQATTEELMAAREELHGVNEELTIMTQELQHQNAALAGTAAELTALFRSLYIPIVTVDNNLRIRRFTPQAEKWFSLAPGDAGRPIHDLQPRRELPDLEPLLRETVESLTVHESEFATADDGRYRLSIRPYRTEDGHIGGAILMLCPLSPRS